MRFVSTRGGGAVTLTDALARGIARDGGLYMPESLQLFELSDFDSAASTRETALTLLRPFFEGSGLDADLDDIVAETFAFPVTLSAWPVGSGTARLLELYHGPTAAFKDVGAAFLAACLSRLQPGHEQPLTILVATSGDTGGAVAAAFDGRAGIEVVVLFPEGRVSARQAHQLTCWGDNVLSLSVRGSFDDCQALVKAAMGDEQLRRRYRFSSANSINVGRLLPQCTYYAHASLTHFRETGNQPGFIVPTGNLGNAFACLLAREMGLPIGNVILATNANRTIGDYLERGEWLPRPSIHTLASAMDVGDPSNMERLRYLLGDADDVVERVSAYSVSDGEIELEIRQVFDESGLALCPHTATATHVYRNVLPAAERSRDWILVATAHAAKFEQIVEPLIGQGIDLPAGLAGILSRPCRFSTIDADLDSLTAAMDGRRAA